MKLNLKMIAIAAAMASLAGTSHAALTGTSNVNNGSMALVAYAQSTGNWYIRDLGYLINDFLPTGITTQAGDGGVSGDKTPAAGLTINSTGAGGATAKSNFADTAFSSWYTAQGANRGTDVLWMVGSYDQVSNSGAQSQRRLIVSSTNAAETFTNSNVDSFTGAGAFGGLSAFFGSATLSQTGDISLGASPLNVGGNGDFNAGVSFANVGSSQSLYYVVRSAYTGATTGAANVANPTAFGNTTGLATVNLSTNGELVYTLAGEPVASAVPVPAAVWLLGSGLMALGAAARRRRAAGQA